MPGSASPGPGPVVLGVDFGAAKISAAVCDLSGRRLAAAAVTSLAGKGARASFDHGVRTARELLAADAAGAPVAAVGVATFGIPAGDGVALAGAIDGWEALPLRRELTAAFPGVPVALANDVKAAALAEIRWGSLAGADPALYVSLGSRLAVAVVSGGEVLEGGHGAAGEIGYCLTRAAELLAAAETDAAASARLSGILDELAAHIVNAAVLLDPVRIVVGGGLTRAWPRIGRRLGAALAAAVPFPPALVLGRFRHEGPLLGAVALACDAASQ